MRYLALGDSYTIGESVEPGERWTAMLAALVRQKGVTVEDPVIIARTGWTTDELSAAIAQSSLSGPFALVSLLIGVNNQYRGRGLEEYREEFRYLLRQAIGLAGGMQERVFVLSIPDWGVTPFAAKLDPAKVSADIDRFNAINREETALAGARYVDITPISRKAATDRTLIARDGLHPSGRMYAEWAREALPSALVALGS